MDKTDKRSDKDAAFVLARHAARLKYEDIPPQVVVLTKMSILDTLGVIVGASGITPGIKELVALIKRAGGKKESSILGFGGRVPVWMAAFCNGAMAHCLDYDDMNDRCRVHPSTSVVPAALALAESLGEVSGKSFITAVALGQDLVCRLGLSARRKFEWHTTPVFGIFGATLSCGKLLNFDEEKYVDAFGIALSQAGTTMEVAYSAGSELRGMYPSFSAKGAVLAALMSNIGIAGPSQSLEGTAGLFNAYFRGEYDRDLLLDNLGKKFENIDTSFKLWPSCRVTHAYIDGSLQLLNEYNIQSQDIAEVVLSVGGLSERCSMPLEERRKPISTLDAKFSLPFCVALALTKQRVTIRDMTPEAIKGPEVLAMAQRIGAKREPELEAMYNRGCYAGKVEICTKEGRAFSKMVEFARGHPKTPLTKEELVAKFMDCTVFSAKCISRDDAECVVELIDNLENINVGEIVPYLS